MRCDVRSVRVLDYCSRRSTVFVFFFFFFFARFPGPSQRIGWASLLAQRAATKWTEKEIN